MSGIVYCNTAGNGVTYTRLDNAIRSILKACSIHKKSPLHAFRHTAAMRLIAANVPVNVVANQLGDTIETVVRNYVKPVLPEQSLIDHAYGAGSGKGQENMPQMPVSCILKRFELNFHEYGYSLMKLLIIILRCFDKG